MEVLEHPKTARSLRNAELCQTKPLGQTAVDYEDATEAEVLKALESASNTTHHEASDDVRLFVQKMEALGARRFEY